MNKYIRLSLVLFCTVVLKIGLNGQSDIPVIVSLEKPKIKDELNYTKANKYLESILEESIAKTPSFVHLVDRYEWDRIKKFRKNFQNGNLAVSSASMLGASYIIENKIIEYNEVIDSSCNKTRTERINSKGKKYWETTSVECKYRRMRMIFEIEMDLVSVETGELINKRSIKLDGFNYIKYEEDFDDVAKNELRLKVYSDMRDCFSILWQRNMLDLIQPRIPILAPSREGKEKIHSFIIESNNVVQSLPEGYKLKIIKLSIAEIGGESIEREELVGVGVILKNNPNHSIIEVKKGEKEAFVSWTNGEKLYVVPDKNMKLTQCSGPNMPSNRRKAMELTSPKTKDTPLPKEKKK